MVAVLRKMYGLMCRRTRESSPTGFGCTGEVCTTLNVSRRQCTTPKRLANMDGGSAKNRSLTLVKKNSQAYCKQLASSPLRAWLNFTPRRAVYGGTSTPLDPSTFSTT